MKRHLAMIGAILRKDVLLVWPLAILAMILLAASILAEAAGLRQPEQLFQVFLPIAAGVASAFLVVVVIQADAPAGIRHDWLTRPVPRNALLAAKTIFVLAVLMLPSIIGKTVAGIRDDKPLGEVLLIATTFQWSSVVSFLTLCVVAAMTATIVEAAVVATTAIVAALFLVPFTTAASGTGEEIYISGSMWFAERPRALFAFIAGAVIIWLMYSSRRTNLARLLFAAAAAVLIASPVFAPWRTVFAAQKRLSSDPGSAATITVARDGTCFSAIAVDPPSPANTTSADDDTLAWSVESPPATLLPNLWSVAQRRKAGANAIGFETRVTVTGATRGWRTVLARVDASYIGSDGQTLRTLRPARFTPTLRRVDSSTTLVGHYWLLPREAYEQLATTRVRLVLDYAFGLLAPTNSAEIPVDGRRHDIAGIGYCGAEFDAATNRLEVDCFKRGPQPAQMTANLVGGSSSTERASNYPDYTPAAFELLGGKSHLMVLRNVPAERAGRVTVTTYEPRAHFNREVALDGVLGESVDACPAPQRAEDDRGE